MARFRNYHRKLKSKFIDTGNTMKTFTIVFVAFAVVVCSPTSKPEPDVASSDFGKGTFGYDLNFLSTRDSLVILKDHDAQIIVSPGFQGKVFTSTAQGSKGNTMKRTITID